MAEAYRHQAEQNQISLTVETESNLPSSHGTVIGEPRQQCVAVHASGWRNPSRSEATQWKSDRERQ